MLFVCEYTLLEIQYLQGNKKIINIYDAFMIPRHRTMEKT